MIEVKACDVTKLSALNVETELAIDLASLGPIEATTNG